MLFSIPTRGEDSYQLTCLICDADFCVGHAVVIHYLTSLGIEVALTDSFEISDVGAGGEGQHTVAVDSSRKGKVGQCEDGTTLTHTTSVQMLRGNKHSGAPIALLDIQQFGTRIRRKAVFLEKLQ